MQQCKAFFTIPCVSKAGKAQGLKWCKVSSHQTTFSQGQGTLVLVVAMSGVKPYGAKGNNSNTVFQVRGSLSLHRQAL
jgi:hypothetical protein